MVQSSLSSKEEGVIRWLDGVCWYRLAWSCAGCLASKGVFSAVRHVEEAILVLLLLVQLPHGQATQKTSRTKHTFSVHFPEHRHAHVCCQPCTQMHTHTNMTCIWYRCTGDTENQTLGIHIRNWTLGCTFLSVWKKPPCERGHSHANPPLALSTNRGIIHLHPNRIGLTHNQSSESTVWWLICHC